MTLLFKLGRNRVSVGPVFTAETNSVFTVGPNCIYTRTVYTRTLLCFAVGHSVITL